MQQNTIYNCLIVNNISMNKIMKSSELFNLPLTLIMVKDPHFQVFTAFFKQFPEIIAEGQNEDDAAKNLMNAVHDVFQYQGQSKQDKQDSHLNITEKSINFCLDNCV
jgi:hypothetical protein